MQGSCRASRLHLLHHHHQGCICFPAASSSASVSSSSRLHLIWCILHPASRCLQGLHPCRDLQGLQESSRVQNHSSILQGFKNHQGFKGASVFLHHHLHHHHQGFICCICFIIIKGAESLEHLQGLQGLAGAALAPCFQALQGFKNHSSICSACRVHPASIFQALQGCRACSQAGSVAVSHGRLYQLHFLLSRSTNLSYQNSVTISNKRGL